MSFSTLNLHPNLLRAIKELGFVRPTPIQAEAIPPAMEGKDVLACAQTGSGKTASFLLPIVHQLMDKPRGTTRALVLVPTRELAAQVHEDLRDLVVHSPVSGAAIYGGVGYGPQEHAFRTGADVIIATPGRLLEHLRAPYAKLDKLEHLVLDEADRMLDMGFLPEIRKILRYLPPVRQTLCFSATMPPEIRALTKEMLKSPVNIQRERVAAPPSAITQAVYPVNQELKSLLLVELLKRGDIKQALVFTRTKHRANRLADALDRHGIQTGRIHGNRSQAQRQMALQQFKTGHIPVLVATDIVARGIDVEQLGHVVNFDVPLVPEDYVHRVGRTGRADATGEAFTFVSPDEQHALAAIERAIGKPLQRVTVPDFDYTAKGEGRLEVPLAQRIAEIRKRKAEDRARSEAKRNRSPGPSSRDGHRPGAGPGRHAGAPRGRQSARPSGDGRPAGAAPDRGRSGQAGSAEGAGTGPRPGGFRGRRFRPR